MMHWKRHSGHLIKTEMICCQKGNLEREKALNKNLEEAKRPSRSDLNQAFRMVDENKDRKLSLEEFKNVKMMMNSRCPCLYFVVAAISYCAGCRCCTISNKS